jgi:hypothetical protein
MVRPGRECLSGVVEVDESYVGGEEEGASGRYTRTKAIVAIAVEIRSPKGFGRIRMQRVAGVAAADLTPFVLKVIEPGSTVQTDGWGGYNEITDLSTEGPLHQLGCALLTYGVAGLLLGYVWSRYRNIWLSVLLRGGMFTLIIAPTVHIVG